MLKPTHQHSRSTPGALLGVLAFALVVLCAATPISSLKLTSDANVNGYSLTNADNLLATNLISAPTVSTTNLTATGTLSFPGTTNQVMRGDGTTEAITSLPFLPSSTSFVSSFDSRTGAITLSPSDLSTSNGFGTGWATMAANALNSTNGPVTTTDMMAQGYLKSSSLVAGSGVSITNSGTNTVISASGGGGISLGTNATPYFNVTTGTLNLIHPPNTTSTNSLVATVLNNFTLPSLSDFDAQLFTFNNPTISGNVGDSTYPVNCIGQVSTATPYESGATIYAKGAITDFNCTSTDGFYTITINSSLTASVNLDVYLYDDGNGGSTVIWNDSTIPAFVLTSFGNNNNYDGGVLTLNCPSATSVDVSQYYNSVGVDYRFTLTCNATAPIIASAINANDGQDTWNGPFTSAFVDALIIAYDTGAMNISQYPASLTIGGSSASPTGASASAEADLTANGTTVTTN